MELNKQRSPKPLPQPPLSSIIPEHPDPPIPSGSRIRGNQHGDGPDAGPQLFPGAVPPPLLHSVSSNQSSESCGQESDSGSYTTIVSLIVIEHSFSALTVEYYGLGMHCILL